MRNTLSLVAILALMGTGSVAYAANTGNDPNGGGQDTSRTAAVPALSQGQNANGMSGGVTPSTGMTASGKPMAPNGGGQDTSRSNAVPLNSQQ